jgi:hypothetical protein
MIQQTPIEKINGGAAFTGSPACAGVDSNPERR